jgi:hypothetical protein
MKAQTLLAAAATVALLAGAARAETCALRIAELDPVLREAAEASIASSSGGQAVAAAREAQAMTDDEDAATTPGDVVAEAGAATGQEAGTEAADGAALDVVPFQDEADEAEAVRRAEAAGEGGDLIMQAIAMVQEAQALDEAGDETACMNRMQDVLRLLVFGGAGLPSGETD